MADSNFHFAYIWIVDMMHSTLKNLAGCRDFYTIRLIKMFLGKGN